MKFRLIAPALILAAPAIATMDAQARPERIEIERVAPQVRVRAIQVARAPRAVLGITTSDGGKGDTLGVLVASVTADGPAARAGLAEGARIQAIGGVSLRITPADADDPLVRDLGVRRLTRELGGKKPGDEVELRVLDGNATRSVRVRLADPDSLYRTREAVGRGMAPAMRAAMANRATLGIEVGATGSRRDTLGVFVLRADDEGPAAKAGLVEGSRIAAIGGVDLRVAAADAGDDLVARSRVQRLMRALADVKPGDEVELRVWTNGQHRTLRVRTVPADSLRRSRATTIFGEDFQFQRAPAIAFPRGEMGEFRFQAAPQVRHELELSAQRARTAAHAALQAARQHRPAAPPTLH